MQTKVVKRKISFSHLFIFLGIIILCSAISLISAQAAFTVADEIYQGVTVADIAVGGLSQIQAKQKIQEIFQQKISEPPLLITYENKQWPISAADIDLQLDADKLAAEAYSVGRTGNLLFRMQEWYMATHSGHVISMDITFNEEKLRTILAQLAKNIDREPQNAFILLKDANNIEKRPEIIGREVDIGANIFNFADKLARQINVVMPLIVKNNTPKITIADLKDIDVVLANYTTQFNAGDRNRVENIKIAAQKIDCSLVHNGEIFSFNDTVGLRLPQFGFKEAPGYVDGILVPDWGGGVCQVSSTLYNAALLADCGIEERTAHCSPPGYVPLGQDATVADHQLDFKFKNTTGYNLYIMCIMSNNQLFVNILGKRPAIIPDITITADNERIIEAHTIIKQDPNLELGSKIVDIDGRRGFEISTYRLKKIDGKIISQELLAHDEFPAVDTVIRVGSKTSAK